MKLNLKKYFENLTVQDIDIMTDRAEQSDYYESPEKSVSHINFTKLIFDDCLEGGDNIVEMTNSFYAVLVMANYYKDRAEKFEKLLEEHCVNENKENE